MLPDSTEARHNSLSVSRRLARLLVPIALAMLLFGLLVWPGLAFDFDYKFRLSTFRPNKAFNPDIAAGGDYVAAVWSEGYDSKPGTKQYGRVYIKGADEANGGVGPQGAQMTSANTQADDSRGGLTGFCGAFSHEGPAPLSIQYNQGLAASPSGGG